MLYGLLLLILLNLIWIGSLLMRINNSLKIEQEEVEMIPSHIITENKVSRKTQVFSPTKDSMAEFNGKRDDWHGATNE